MTGVAKSDDKFMTKVIDTGDKYFNTNVSEKVHKVVRLVIPSSLCPNCVAGSLPNNRRGGASPPPVTLKRSWDKVNWGRLYVASFIKTINDLKHKVRADGKSIHELNLKLKILKNLKSKMHFLVSYNRSI